ncbi:polyprenyl synthetase family protein, partial [Agromyces sp. NPDC058126]|uniref:polyprenyl synthetase family protein n=1 Tax=Agromyces sp. NPDC058126 TaxID=3346350 RepID=UPI0036DD6F1B
MNTPGRLSKVDAARLAEEFADARVRIQADLVAVVESLPDEMAHVAGYHLGWWDAAGAPSNARGKGLRPAVLLAAAESVGGPTAREKAVPLAAALELVHEFSLLHDDIMDSGRTRRNRATTWTVFGRPKALLVGDLFAFAAIKLVNQQHHPRGTSYIDSFIDAILSMCVGQSEDLAHESEPGITLSDSMGMIAGKTGALLACASGLGASIADAPPAHSKAFERFGQELGIAFQLHDDVQGIWGDERTGKDVGSDLIARKRTAPIVFALASDTRAGDELTAALAQKAPWTPAEVERIAGLIEETGARTWAESEAMARMAD